MEGGEALGKRKRKSVSKDLGNGEVGNEKGKA